MKDLTGEKFNYLTVLGFSHKCKKSSMVDYFWTCRCECGKILVVSRRSLTRGRKSCGCMSNVSHVGSSYHKGVATHGMSSSRFYKIYHKMLERCYKETKNTYSRFGIVVCDRWKESFINFKDDMYASYLEHVSVYGESNTSLDRIDVGGNYELSNCKWSTLKEQANNKSNNVVIEFNGKKMTLSQWADYLGWNYATLANRYKRNWEVSRMLTEKPRYQK